MELSEAAAAMGRVGAKASNAKLTPKELTEKMRRAARARWDKTPKSESSKTRARRGKEGAA